MTARGKALLKQLEAKFDELAHEIAVRHGFHSEPASKCASLRDDRRGRETER